MNKEELRFKYQVECKTTRKIAEEHGITKTSVLYWLDKHGIKRRGGGRQPVNLIGNVYGGLTVISKDLEKNDKKRCYWICECSCGKNTSIQTSALFQGQSKCWDCRNNEISNRRWKGYGEISMDKFSAIKKSAEKRKISFEITIEYIWDLFLIQDRKCALTGEEIYFQKRRSDESDLTASLDRIDSSIGYIEGNVQWVHKKINQIKWDLNIEELVIWCKKIIKTYENITAINEIKTSRPSKMAPK